MLSKNHQITPIIIRRKTEEDGSVTLEHVITNEYTVPAPERVCPLAKHLTTAKLLCKEMPIV